MTSKKTKKCKLQTWCQTDVGRKREANEDSYVEDHGIQLYGVADGMGGHDFGDIASQTSIAVVTSFLNEQKAVISKLEIQQNKESREVIRTFMDQAVLKASNAIFQLALQKTGSRGMGTTLSIFLIAGNHLFCGHVGDSRIYLFRNNELKQLTQDHSFVAEQVRLGLLSEAEAEIHPFRNMITRAVGATPELEVDTFVIELQKDDLVFACSDGLHGYFPNIELESLFQRKAASEWLSYLVETSNQRGGKDNITGVLVHVQDVFEESTSTPELLTSSTPPQEQEVSLRMDLLRQIPLFKHMTYPELVKVMNITYMKTFHPMEYIHHEGEKNDTLYILLNGEVSLLEKDTKVSKVSQGDHFGELSFIDKSPHTNSAVVEKTSQVLTIPRKELIRLMRKEKEIAVKLLWGMLKGMSHQMRGKKWFEE